MPRIKPAGKAAIMVLFAGALIALFYFRKSIIPEGKLAENVTGLMRGSDSADVSGDNSPSAANTHINKCIEIGVVTWGGYVGGQYWNQGFKDNPNSRYRKDGICVNFKVMDDFAASRAAFRGGEMDMMWSTIDSFPTESGGFGKVKWLFQADWSRGGDAIVVRKGIKSVADLAGKKIAVAEGTPSHTFLLWMLDMGGLSMMDVTIIKQNNAIDAATAFKSNNVDAAVVWSPDDAICVQAVPGASVLINTKKATHIIADGFFVKEKNLQARRDDFIKLVQGWLKGAKEINDNPAAKATAAKILQENLTGIEPGFALEAINNTRLATYGDNLEFFGLDQNYKGVTGQELYTKMTTVYGKLNLAPNPLPWDQIVDLDFIKSLGLDVSQGGVAEQKTTFTSAPSAQIVQAKAIASKPVKVSFASGSSVLDENAKGLIDMLFIEQAKAFPGQHIRIIGNTDNTGNAAVNTRISKERAKAVVEYLVSQHGFDRNRFAPLNGDGVGPSNPLCTDDTPACLARNRRTDFQILEN
jgi:NitT/TauT family transport system substrate-binding protein